jgi:catechol 2,3-dioxygenase-like lactoylglutathione lyase family enzyme
MSSPAATAHITAVATVFVTVNDQDAALEFYRDKLGMEVRSDTSYGGGERWIEVAPPGAATVIALVPPRGDGKGQQPGSDLAFGYDTDDLDAAVAELSERGVRFEDVMRMPDPVPPMVFFADQDGNRGLLVQRH